MILVRKCWIKEKKSDSMKIGRGAFLWDTCWLPGNYICVKYSPVPLSLVSLQRMCVNGFKRKNGCCALYVSHQEVKMYLSPKGLISRGREVLLPHANPCLANQNDNQTCTYTYSTYSEDGRCVDRMYTNWERNWGVKLRAN